METVALHISDETLLNSNFSKVLLRTFTIALRKTCREICLPFLTRIFLREFGVEMYKSVNEPLTHVKIFARVTENDYICTGL